MLLFIIIGFIFVLTLGYFFLMFFFPEWVGISGDDTKEAIEAHKDENTSPSDPSSQDS